MPWAGYAMTMQTTTPHKRKKHSARLRPGIDCRTRVGMGINYGRKRDIINYVHGHAGKLRALLVAIHQSDDW